jgi:hypothetical protein
MERKLVKSAIYTFITSFCLLLAFLDQTPTVQTAEGMYTTMHIEFGEFFLMIVQYSIRITLVVVLLVFLIEVIKKRKNA